MIRRAAVALLLVILAACSGGGGGVDLSDQTTVPVTPVPVFDGDPESPFCVTTRSFGDDPAPDPFRDGLDPVDVQVELRAAVLRVERLVDSAPEAIVEDATTVLAGLLTLDNLLGEFDYDLNEAVAAGVESELFTDRAFADAGARIAAFQRDVCGVDRQ